jgi:hypothetical protein
LISWHGCSAPPKNTEFFFGKKTFYLFYTLMVYLGSPKRKKSNPETGKSTALNVTRTIKVASI